MHTSKLVGRVQRLERDVRIMKVVVASAIAVLVAIPLTGAVQGVPNVIEAREFRVLNDQGQATAWVKPSGFQVRGETGRGSDAQPVPDLVMSMKRPGDSQRPEPHSDGRQDYRCWAAYGIADPHFRLTWVSFLGTVGCP